MQAGEAGDIGDGDATSSAVAPDASLREAASDLAAPDAALPDAVVGDAALSDAVVGDAVSELAAPDAASGFKLVSLFTSNTSLTARVGQIPPIRVFGLYSDMSQQDVTSRVQWTSSDPSLVWPPQAPNEYFAMLADGQAILTATLDGVSTTVTMTVSGWGGTLLGVVLEGSKPLMRPGETGQVRLSYYYSLGPEVRLNNPTWVSSNPAVLSVSAHGSTTALSVGSTTVSAVLADKTVASMLITVRDVTLASIIIGPSNLTIPFPDRLPVTATGVYSDGSKFDLTHVARWESSAGDIIIDQQTPPAATATAVGRVGSFPISASFEEVSGSSTITVPFGHPDSFLIQEASELPVGIPYPVVAYAYYRGLSGLDVSALVTWSVDDPSVATIAAGGLVHALKPGTTLVRASYPGATIAPLTLTVSQASLLTIELSPQNVQVYRTDPPQRFTAQGTYDSGQVFDVTGLAVWSTGNPQVASVSNAAASIGSVTGLKVGTTAVRAALAGVTGSTILTVQPDL
jgi:hypothetical protein